MEKFKLFSEPVKIYKEMIKDINQAKKSIFLETYIYDDDEIGKQFLQALIKKAKQGIKIKLLLDSWGSTAKKDFFNELIKQGAEVRFFREIRYFIRIFSKNHERNHRKLLLIDNKISYVGSANITYSCIKDRELVVRFEDDITKALINSFNKSWESYGRITKKRLKTILHEELEIINDIPNTYYRITERRYSRLIKKAKKTIRIETPYFVPPISIRKSLINAVKRGVKVILIIPYNSEIKLVNIIRNRYLGPLYKAGVEINYYKPYLLHSKLLIIDNNFFLFGSSNLDYRSFIYQYEINFIGKDRDIINALINYFNETLSLSIPFNYEEWKNRSSFGKILELIINRIRHYL